MGKHTLFFNSIPFFHDHFEVPPYTDPWLRSPFPPERHELIILLYNTFKMMAKEIVTHLLFRIYCSNAQKKPIFTDITTEVKNENVYPTLNNTKSIIL